MAMDTTDTTPGAQMAHLDFDRISRGVTVPTPPETPVTTVATGHPAPTKVATVCIKQFTLQYGTPRALGGYCRQAFHVGPPSKPPINIQISPTPV